jgi:hypothetical protein
MSDRLAEALVRMAGKVADDRVGEPAFIAIKGVDLHTAAGMGRLWSKDDDGFALKIAAPPGADMQGRALTEDETATSVRNDAGNKLGVCLVICEGERVPDRQGVKGLDVVEPAALLTDEPHWEMLASAAEPAEGPDVVEVGQAIRDLPASERPTALRVAAFLDEVAANPSEDAAMQLPLLGAFRDEGPLSAPRLVDNIQLAARLEDPDTTRPGSVKDMTDRAHHQLGASRAERVLALLYGDVQGLLRELSYGEAAAILREPPAKDLPDTVKDQLGQFKERLEDDPEGLGAIVDDLIDRAEDLRDRDARQEASDELLSFHDDRQAEGASVFRPDTETRLKGLRRNSKISAGESVERALIKAIAGVGVPESIEVRSPTLPEDVAKESDARAVLAYAALRLRAEPLLALLRSRGVDVSGSTSAELGERIKQATEMLDTPREKQATTMNIAVRGKGRGNIVEIVWTPSAEDLVLVLLNHRFQGAKVSTLKTSTAPGRPLRSAEIESAGRSSTFDAAAAQTADAVAAAGFAADPLEAWAAAWVEAVSEASKGPASDSVSEGLTVVGCVEFPGDALLLTHLHPLKSEWLAARTRAWLDLLALLLEEEERRRDVLAAAEHVAAANASQYPAYLWYGPGADPLVPSMDGSVVSIFGGGRAPSNITPPPVSSVEQVLDKLVMLHREVQPHLRVAALGDHACDLALRALTAKLGLQRKPFDRAELVCISGRPSDETLLDAEELERRSPVRQLQLAYVDSIDYLALTDTPAVHLALVSGLGDRAGGRNVAFGEAQIVDPPGQADPLFAPKTWLRVRRNRGTLLCPPGVTPTYSAHLIVQAAPREGWRRGEEEKSVATLSVDVGAVKEELVALHRYAQWVLTVDRYAARDTLQRLLGKSVAILHQERRTSGAVTEGLIISQRSGGAADRAIARALTSNQIEANEVVAEDLARRLRVCASRGHGVLALRAATTGSGINELLGHVAGFAELTRRASPQPIPQNSRLLLVSLDEYKQWFGKGRRADLLVLALPADAKGEVWAANVEVKTVLSAGDQRKARREAKTQLLETLKDSHPAIRPDGSVFSRMWLNRIVEAAVSVARENDVRLTEAELNALNRFRSQGTPSNDWGGIGLVFGPEELPTETPQIRIGNDRIPLFLYGVKLDRELLRAAAETDPGDLRTSSDAGRQLRSSSKDRLRKAPASGEAEAEQPPIEAAVRDEPIPLKSTVEVIAHASTDKSPPPAEQRPAQLGVNASTGEPVEWRVSGPNALSNGHVEIYGQSGFGKTQLVKSLLAQLRGAGSHFSVCDFKDDYGVDEYGTDFPAAVGARFFELYAAPVPFNPMAGHSGSKRDMQSFCIELRDMVDIAAKQYVRMGPRQLGKLLHALEESFEYARVNGRADPLLQDVGGLIDDDLEGILGDLFRFEFFGAGPPFGELVDHDSIFSFAKVPGRGLTEDLLAGFVLSSFYLKMQTAPAVHSTVRFAVVVDEAHRVSGYKAVKSMVSEQRSKGVAVILATQKPGQLPPEVETNAQTKVFLNLPGQDAKEAAKRLDPDNKDLPELIRTLAPGEAFVSIGGQPVLVRLRQYWRDDAASNSPDEP